jgi:hypothetical protein
LLATAAAELPLDVTVELLLVAVVVAGAALDDVAALPELDGVLVLFELLLLLLPQPAIAAAHAITAISETPEKRRI